MKNAKSIALFLSAFVSIFLSVQSWAFDHSYKNWDAFLKKFVVSDNHASKVRYMAANKDRALLDRHLQDVEAVKKKEYDAWSPEQKQAFLINAYNALTVKLILDGHVPKSIKDLGGLFQQPLEKKFFKLFGEEAYLDKIEHEMARAQFNNCRFHFAFNCASVGCPMLRKEAWLPERLAEQFEDSARRFINDKSRNVFNVQSNTLELSKIFDWYGEDFKKDKSCGGSVQAFVAKYMEIPAGRKLSSEMKVKFLKYDWNLNGSL